MIGVEGNQDVILFRQAVYGFSQHHRAERSIIHREARGKLTPTGRKLDNPVGI